MDKTIAYKRFYAVCIVSCSPTAGTSRRLSPVLIVPVGGLVSNKTVKFIAVESSIMTAGSTALLVDMGILELKVNAFI